MERLVKEAKALGAYNAGVVPVSAIPFERELRKACEANYCGHYGKNWTCPPLVGDIDELIAQAKQYKTALVYQTVGTLEDSFDYEGMVAALQKHVEISDMIAKLVRERVSGPILQLSAGGCPVCERCTGIDKKPCRYPDRALASLEAYGIYVSKLAGLCGLNYINGQNTVTYFGAFLIDRE
jgi:predicted metal-binding protein